ncbi:unnamed protein product, partial [Onchocerca ochengi]
FSKVSSSDNISSTESDTSEIEEENMTKNETTRNSDNESITSKVNDISSTRRLSHAWIKSDTVPNDRNINENYDNVQQNSTLQRNDLQLNSISQTFPVQHKLSSFTPTNRIFSNENIEQK